MRTTVTLDDELVAKATEFAGIKEKSALINHALRRYIQQEAARRLRLLAGTDPSAMPGRRRRDESEE